MTRVAETLFLLLAGQSAKSLIPASGWILLPMSCIVEAHLMGPATFREFGFAKFVWVSCEDPGFDAGTRPPGAQVS